MYATRDDIIYMYMLVCLDLVENDAIS
jgi:hypothetical protein